MVRLVTSVVFFMAILLGGALPASASPAGASKVVALVIGNSAPDEGLTKSELVPRLDALKDRLFHYGSETLLFTGVDLSRDDMSKLIQQFQARLGGADVAVVYYAGRSAHTDSDSYLVPADGSDGQIAGLIPVRPILAEIRNRVPGRAMVFLDSVKPKAGFKSRGVLPGFGRLDAEADGNKLSLAYSSLLPGSMETRTPLSMALLQHLQPKRVDLTRLASLVQQDVSFQSSGMHVPRVSGAVQSNLALDEVSGDELDAKTRRCVADRGGDDAGVKLASADRTGESTVQLSARQGESVVGRSEWHLFCPFFEPAPEARAVIPEEEVAPPSKSRKGNGSAHGRSHGGNTAKGRRHPAPARVREAASGVAPP